MSVMPTGTYRVQRALTDSEMATIRNRIGAATNAAEIVAGAVQATFSALLTSVGESLDEYGSNRRLVSTEYAIPQTQWTAIVEAATSKADAYGMRVQVAFQLIDVMPSTYEDPAAPVTAVRPVDHRPPEHVLTVTREATDVITAASAYCDRIAAAFGPGSREYMDAITSWQRNLSQVFSMCFGADTRVSRDGELNLLVRSGSGLVYGIIFHPCRRRCARPGCKAVINDDGRAWTYRPDDPHCADDRHEPTYPVDAPAPGTWSFHS